MTASAGAHTPGPWHYAGTVVRDDHDHDIARMCDKWHWQPDAGPLPLEVQLANARLIAAAPIMYDYISKKAQEGDKEAQRIIDSL